MHAVDSQDHVDFHLYGNYTFWLESSNVGTGFSSWDQCMGDFLHRTCEGIPLLCQEGGYGEDDVNKKSS